MKLGYGGTKAEMQRLLEDANALNEAQGIHTEYQLDNYADIIEAIHTVQSEMGITGTTQLEAATTIQGSLSMVKASWENLKVGVANDEADLDKLMKQFTTSIGIAAKNLLPVVKTAITGSAEVIETLFPEVVMMIPEIIAELLPSVMAAAVSIITTLADGIINNPGAITAAVPKIIHWIVETIVTLLPKILSAGAQIVLELVVGLIASIPEIVAAVPELIGAIVEGIEGFFTTINTKGEEIVQQFQKGMKTAWDNLVSWFNGVWDSLFGNRDANVNVNVNQTVRQTVLPTSSMTPSGLNRGQIGTVPKKRAASGLEYVPHNGYIAELHRGERILTAEEATAFRMGGGNTNNISIHIDGARYADESELAEAIAERLERMTQRKELVYA